MLTLLWVFFFFISLILCPFKTLTIMSVHTFSLDVNCQDLQGKIVDWFFIAFSIVLDVACLSTERYSCAACFGQIDLTESVPLQAEPQLMSSNITLVMNMWPLILHPVQWLQPRKPFAQWCHVIITLVASITMERSLPHCANWSLTLHDGLSAFFNPVGCLATSLIRKAWWVNKFSHWWPWPCVNYS